MVTGIMRHFEAILDFPIYFALRFVQVDVPGDSPQLKKNYSNRSQKKKKKYPFKAPAANSPPVINPQDGAVSGTGNGDDESA